VRAGFLRARGAERDGAPTGDAVLNLRRALDTLPDAGPAAGRAGDELRGLRTAVETYVQAVADGGAVAWDRRTTRAAAGAIDAALGQLRDQDEALLREPLVGMRLAENSVLSGGDPWSKRQLSRWAALFSTRLNEVAIPRGTRAELAGMLVVYEHGVLTGDATGGGEGRAALVAAHGVETALANADLALAAETWRRDGAAHERHWWLASVLSGADGFSGLARTVCGRLSMCVSPEK
jgi:hypothetical protein